VRREPRQGIKKEADADIKGVDADQVCIYPGYSKNK